MQKQGGEGLLPFITWVHDVNIYLGRQRGRGTLQQKSTFEAIFAALIHIFPHIHKAKMLRLVAQHENTGSKCLGPL